MVLGDGDHCWNVAEMPAEQKQLIRAVVLFLFNNVIYAFLLCDCMFIYDYRDWDFFRAFSSVVRQMPG